MSTAAYQTSMFDADEPDLPESQPNSSRVLVQYRLCQTFAGNLARIDHQGGDFFLEDQVTLEFARHQGSWYFGMRIYTGGENAHGMGFAPSLSFKSGPGKVYGADTFAAARDMALRDALAHLESRVEQERYMSRPTERIDKLISAVTGARYIEYRTVDQVMEADDPFEAENAPGLI